MALCRGRFAVCGYAMSMNELTFTKADTGNVGIQLGAARGWHAGPTKVLGVARSE